MSFQVCMNSVLFRSASTAGPAWILLNKPAQEELLLEALLQSCLKSSWLLPVEDSHTMEIVN